MKVMLKRLNSVASGSLIRRNISLTLMRQLLAALAQFLLIVLVARALGPEGNGYYAMAILLPSLLNNFLNFGVGSATVYYVSRCDYSAREAMLGNFRLALIFSIIGVLITLPIIQLWGTALFPGIPRELLYIGLAGFPLSITAAYLNTILQGIEDFKSFNIAVLLPPYVNLLVVAVALYGFKVGVVGAMAGYLVSQVAALMVAVFYLKGRSSINDKVGGGFYNDYSRKILSYGWKAHLSNILAFVNYRADIYLVNLILSPATTGIYVIAVQIAERLWILSQAVSTVLLPRLSSMHDDPRGRLKLTQRAGLVVFLASAAVSAAAAVLLDWMIAPVFGKVYEEALPAFVWLLPGVVAASGSRVYANCIAAAGKPEWNMYVSFLVMIINIVGNIILIPEYGIVGAALATSLSYLFNAVAKFWLVRMTL